jgi:hypothetical protein
MITRLTPFRSVGPCPFAAWVDVAMTVESPIPGPELEEMHAVAGPHSALCLSQCVKESTLGRDQSARLTRNPLGLMKSDGSTLQSFPTWADAVRNWLTRITDLSYKGGVYAPWEITLEQYLATYVGGPGCWTTRGITCANGETWDGENGGSVGLYIQQTVDRLNDYTEGASMANPYPAPTIYSLSRDYARFGLTQPQANKIGSHKFAARQGKKPMAMVLHIQEGTTKSSLSWWASGNADASATVMVQKDGSILRVIPESDGPWTNGDVKAPSQKGQQLLNKIGGANPNLVTLSIETEGRSGEVLPQAAVNAICWQLTEWMTTYGLTKNDIYKHADLNSVTRAFCPGSYFDAVMAQLNAGPITPPTPEPPPPAADWPGKPAWLPSELVKVLFPEADPTGLRTQAWFAECNRTGRAPRRVAFHGSGALQLIEFSDGTLIDTTGKVVSK